MKTDLFGLNCRVHGKHYRPTQGYAASPGTGPAGETCGSCAHCVRRKRYYKCGLNQASWTASRATDILKHAPACVRWVLKNRQEDPKSGSIRRDL